MFVVVFPKVFGKQQKPSGKPKIQKKTKENPKNLREHQINTFFKGCRPTLGYVCLFLLFVWFSWRFLEHQKNLRENKITKCLKVADPPLDMCFFVVLVFLKVFRTPTKTFGKTNNTKENQNNIRENQKTNVFKGCRPTLGYGFVCFVFWVLPKVFRKPQKPSGKPTIHSGKPKKTKENQTTFGKTNKTQSF